jgi:uncharacterized membrane protein YccC
MLRFGRARRWCCLIGRMSREAAGVKLLGFILLLAGWAIVLAALVLLSRELARNVFVLAGLSVALMGIVLAFRAHPVLRGEED